MANKLAKHSILKICLTIIFLVLNFVMVLVSNKTYYVFFYANKLIYLIIYTILTILNLIPFLKHDNKFLDNSLYFYYALHTLANFFAYIIVCQPVSVIFFVATNLCLLLNFFKYRKIRYRYPAYFLPLVLGELVLFLFYYLAYIFY